MCRITITPAPLAIVVKAGRACQRRHRAKSSVALEEADAFDHMVLRHPTIEDPTPCRPAEGACAYLPEYSARTIPNAWPQRRKPRNPCPHAAAWHVFQQIWHAMTTPQNRRRRPFVSLCPCPRAAPPTAGHLCPFLADASYCLRDTPILLASMDFSAHAKTSGPRPMGAARKLDPAIHGAPSGHLPQIQRANICASLSGIPTDYLRSRA